MRTPWVTGTAVVGGGLAVVAAFLTWSTERVLVADHVRTHTFTGLAAGFPGQVTIVLGLAMLGLAGAALARRAGPRIAATALLLAGAGLATATLRSLHAVRNPGAAAVRLERLSGHYAVVLYQGSYTSRLVAAAGVSGPTAGPGWYLTLAAGIVLMAGGVVGLLRARRATG